MDDASRCRLIRTLFSSLAVLLILQCQATAAKAKDEPLLFPGGEKSGLEHVTLQLPWSHQFRFAGYYVAQERGYFREAGLNVTILPGGFDGHGEAPNPVEEVVFKRADFGISRSELLIHHSYGLPVTVLANIMQRSPQTFLTLERYDLTRLEEIGERPVGLPVPYDQGLQLNAEALATLRATGIAHQELHNTTSASIGDLLNGRVEMISADSTDAIYFIRQQGETPVEISPKDYGIDFYGDLLFTHRSLAEQRPDLVAAFREAVLRGWKYALSHADETAQLISQHYPLRHGYDLDFLRHEAQQLRALMQPELIEVGYSNPERWEAIGETLVSLGIIEDYDLGGFLYQPQPMADFPPLPHVWRWTLLALAVLAVAMTLACYLHMMNRELRREMERRKSAEHALRHQAEKDGLTGIDNRRLFETRLQQEFDRARRHGRALSVILFDVDHFKRFNDRHGHLLGDQVLIQIATVTQAVLRSCDHFARYGGEEFVVLLPDTELSEASLIAHRIWQANREHRVVSEALVIGYTLSLGIAALSPDDENGHQLLKRADTELYRAKASGRDRCCKAEQA